MTKAEIIEAMESVVLNYRFYGEVNEDEIDLLEISSRHCILDSEF